MSHGTILRLSAMLALIAASLVAIPAITYADELKSPFVEVQPKLKGKETLTCDTPAPEAVVSLDVSSMYDQTDPSRSTIDQDQLDDYLAGMKPVREFLSGLTGYTSNYVASKGVKVKYAICALIWLDTWAKAGALSDLKTRQAILSSTRIVSGMALAYLIVRPVADKMDFDTGPLNAWFKGASERFISAYEDTGDLNSNKANHRYWGGLAVAAVGVAIGDEADLQWGVDSYQIGVCQVTSDGALPLELKRKKKARDYHLVATAPLVMIAELAEANGIDAYGLCGGAIHRLVKFTLNSVEHPELIEKLADAKMQKLPTKNGDPRGDRFAWVEPYFKRFGGNEQAYGFSLERPLFSSNLGGRVTIYTEPPQSS